MGRVNVPEGTGPLRQEREQHDGTRLGHYFSSLLERRQSDHQRWPVAQGLQEAMQTTQQRGPLLAKATSVNARRMANGMAHGTESQ